LQRLLLEIYIYCTGSEISRTKRQLGSNHGWHFRVDDSWNVQHFIWQQHPDWWV